MSKNQKEGIIKSRLQKLARSIEKHNNYYHNLDKPVISDSDYDKLVKENNSLEKKFPHLILTESPNKSVGSKIKSKFVKTKHLSQMYSLGNAFDEEDIFEFIKRINKYLNLTNDIVHKFLIEPKIDGLSLNLLYKKGRLVTAATRGDGLIGEDVTENIKKLKAYH